MTIVWRSAGGLPVIAGRRYWKWLRLLLADRLPPLRAGALTVARRCLRLPGMSSKADEFCQLIAAVLTRFFAQNAQPTPSVAARADFAARLWTLVAERGVPPALAPGESGAPREMSEDETAPLVARVLGNLNDPLLAEAARQLVKACFYPEFKTCRESYRAVSPDGACRRQELARARRRVSGSHCVDCPYWQAMEPAGHARFLAAAWCTDAREFEAHRSVFLPEDFRALRRWIRAQA